MKLHRNESRDKTRVRGPNDFFLKNIYDLVTLNHIFLKWTNKISFYRHWLVHIIFYLRASWLPVQRNESIVFALHTSIKGKCGRFRSCSRLQEQPLQRRSHTGTMQVLFLLQSITISAYLQQLSLHHEILDAPIVLERNIIEGSRSETRRTNLKFAVSGRQQKKKTAR